MCSKLDIKKISTKRSILQVGNTAERSTHNQLPRSDVTHNPTAKTDDLDSKRAKMLSSTEASPSKTDHNQPKFILNPANFNSVVYGCMCCSVVHTDYQSAVIHQQSCFLTCKVCHKTFRNMEEMGRHSKEHLQPFQSSVVNEFETSVLNKQPCTLCTNQGRGSKFFTPQELNYHMDTVHSTSSTSQVIHSERGKRPPLIKQHQTKWILTGADKETDKQPYAD